jgi:hypothetical protein
MNTSDQIKLTGEVKIVVFNEKTGEVKESRTIPNLVVSAGKAFVASRLVGTSQAVMSHMALGAGTTAPAPGDTTPGSELGRTALGGSSAAGAVVTYSATFGAGVATGAVTEAAILNAPSGGTMLCRTTFAVVNKGADDAMAVTWAVTAS